MTGVAEEFITGGGFLIGAESCGGRMFGGGTCVRAALPGGNTLVTVFGGGQVSETFGDAKVRITWMLPVGPSRSCLRGAVTEASVGAGRLDAVESGVRNRTGCEDEGS
jgi:hypothetical protein